MYDKRLLYLRAKLQIQKLEEIVGSLQERVQLTREEEQYYDQVLSNVELSLRHIDVASTESSLPSSYISVLALHPDEV
ncbi:MAG: hypothetical protein MOGMAGMI_00079 [Candidatus Omnitrophica bacterium]|nr:hypothetical protein [Candidatus Omnitrophota bacterium]